MASRSFFQLTREEIQAKNKEFMAALLASDGSDANLLTVMQIDKVEAGKLLGIKQLDADDDTPAWCTFKGKRYIATNNKTNRPLSVNNMKALGKFFKEGRWALNGEVLIFDQTGMAASCQHRLAAIYFFGNDGEKYPVITVKGVPVEFVDSIDTGKTRDNKDIASRHDNIFPIETLTNVIGVPFGPKSNEVRTKLLKDMNSAARMIWLRTNGKDVKASSTGFKQDSMFEMLDKCPELQELTLLVYNQDTGTTGKAGKLGDVFGRAAVITALVLYSNQHTTPENGTSEGREYEIPQLEVDLEFAKSFCQCAVRPDGFMQPLYAHKGAIKGKNKLDTQYLMGALVEAIKWFDENSSESNLESTNPETGVKSVTTVVQCPPLPNAGIPREPGLNPQTGKKNAWKWSHFGGVDIGYIAKVKKSDDIADEETQD